MRINMWGIVPMLSLVYSLLFSSPCHVTLGSEITAESRFERVEELSWAAFMQRVVDYNDTIQGQLLGFQSARHLRKAETGVSEPAFVASTEFVDRDQPNNFQLERSLGLLNGQDPGGYPSIFLERNWNYSSAIEVATPFGTRFRLGATASEIRNNVPRPAEFIDVSEEVSTQVGFSLEQPLLKGMGFGANLASLRLAARQSEIAF